MADTGNEKISHTEGQGVAMLAAALLGDEEQFNQTWAWTQKNLQRADKLFSWKWVPGKGIVDANNASDGELYIIWALVEAGVRFNRKPLLGEATAIAKALRERCIVMSPRHGAVLLPGEQGFAHPQSDGMARIVVNLAYWVFPALEHAYSVDPNPVWAEVQKNGLALLKNYRFGKWDLPADWTRLTDTAIPWEERPARFGYEGIRIPLFLSWGGHAQHSALAKFARFASRPGFPAWVGFDDKSQADYPAPAGFEAVAQLARQSFYGQATAWPAMDKDYFSASLLLMAQLSRLPQR